MGGRSGKRETTTWNDRRSLEIFAWKKNFVKVSSGILRGVFRKKRGEENSNEEGRGRQRFAGEKTPHAPILRARRGSETKMGCGPKGK